MGSQIEAWYCVLVTAAYLFEHISNREVRQYVCGLRLQLLLHGAPRLLAEPILPTLTARHTVGLQSHHGYIMVQQHHVYIMMQ